MRTNAYERCSSCNPILWVAVLLNVSAAMGCDSELLVGTVKGGSHEGVGGASPGSGGAHFGTGGASAGSGGRGGNGATGGTIYGTGGARVGTGGTGLGTGGTRVGTGGTGLGTGGVPSTTGSGGSGAPSTACNSISTSVGVQTDCGRTYGVAYSASGHYLAAALGAESVMLWNLQTGALVRSTEGAYSVAFSPDETLLAAGGDAANGGSVASVTIVNVATGALVRRLPTSAGFYVDSVAFSRDGSLLATAGYMGTVEIWRVADGARVVAIPYPTSVHNVHFSPDDSKLIVGGVDQRATIWNLPAGTLAMTLTGTAGEMADAVFSPDGLRIASTGVDNVIKVWDAATGTMLAALPGHTAYVSHVLWADNTRFLTDDWSGNVIEWTSSQGTFKQTKTWSLGSQALGMALSPDGKTVAVADDRGIAFIAP